MATLGAWVKENRKRRKMTQAQLGEAVGRSRNQIVRIESGEQGTTREVVREIARVTGANWEEGAVLLAAYQQEVEGLRREPDPDRDLVLEAYDGATPQARRLLIDLARNLRSFERDTAVGGHTSDQ